MKRTKGMLASTVALAAVLAGTGLAAPISTFAATAGASSATATSTSTYTDVNYSDWYAQGVVFCQENGLLTGYGNGRFGVGQSLTTEQLATVLWRLAEPEEAASYDASTARDTTGFSDTASRQWYTGAVNWAKREGVINGYAGARLGLGEAIDTERFCAIMKNYLDPNGTTDTSNLSHFQDEASISSWARQGTSWALAKGLLSGYPTSTGYVLGATMAIYRERVAVILMNAVDNGVIVLPEPTPTPTPAVTTYTISFDANGGSGSMASLTASRDASVSLGRAAFTRAGYDFAGWNTRADGTGASYADGASVTNLASAGGTVTLYAQWKAQAAPIPLAQTYATLYSDGELVFAADDDTESGRTVVAHGRGSDVFSVDPSTGSRVEDGSFLALCRSSATTINSTCDVKVTDADHMYFGYWTALRSVPGLARWDVSAVTNFGGDFTSGGGYGLWGLFCGDSSLTDVSGLRNWDVSNVTNMDVMFLGCQSLADISPLAGWNVTNVTEFDETFSFCSSLKDLSPIFGWDVQQSDNLWGMFGVSSDVTLPSWYTTWEENYNG